MHQRNSFFDLSIIFSLQSKYTLQDILCIREIFHLFSSKVLLFLFNYLFTLWYLLYSLFFFIFLTLKKNQIPLLSLSNYFLTITCIFNFINTLQGTIYIYTSEKFLRPLNYFLTSI